MVYLLLVRYRSEAERKRLEYLIEKWEGNVRIKRPGGAVLIIDGGVDNILKFLEELYSKIPRDEVSIYKLAEPDLHISPLSLEADVRTLMDVNEVWGAIGLITAKLRAILISETSNSRIYQVSTKGGSCRVRFIVSPLGSGSLVTFIVEGFGAVVSNVFSRLVKEFSLIGEVIKRE